MRWAPALIVAALCVPAAARAATVDFITCDDACAVTRLDATTLKPVGQPIDLHTDARDEPDAYDQSPDGSRFALLDSGGVSLYGTGTARVKLKDSAYGLAWLERDRLLAVGAGRVEIVDPVKGKRVKAVRVPAQGRGAGVVGARLATLGVVHHRASLSLVSTAGKVETIALPKLPLDSSALGLHQPVLSIGRKLVVESDTVRKVAVVTPATRRVRYFRTPKSVDRDGKLAGLGGTKVIAVSHGFGWTALRVKDFKRAAVTVPADFAGTMPGGWVGLDNEQNTLHGYDRGGNRIWNGSGLPPYLTEVAIRSGRVIVLGQNENIATDDDTVAAVDPATGQIEATGKVPAVSSFLRPSDGVNGADVEG